ncbi:ATP-dependent RNA helicase, putative [Candida dubliniensis CD36]|uniref:ATP-dependent RNA helicase n=1 Tax=Candida dubliniensis (strain CD36 / ATCC MYA-646 / CBS 7987 / NCPF 3949 / NRRL Y-17841) TaxID=573826 RepID=B9WMH2_CANDC|nr:ATP-dependent RNA helicase, putative [Candida dubliniensis CD36]CAX40285.1 ATP-dependent RNA helicase, putative [Candida dubliniensis CD36]
MFSQRYDPLADQSNGIQPVNSGFGVSLKKRKLSESESSEDEEETNESEHNPSQDQNISEEEEEEEEEEENNSKIDDRMDIDSQPEVDQDYIHKHQAIFNKFKQSTESEVIEQEHEENEEENKNIEQHSLVPLPQPALPRDRKLSSVSTHTKNLDWLTKPQYASPQDKEPFTNFKLSSFMIKSLEKMGFTEAFSVQISVLKMMLPEIEAQKLKPDRVGDILVNASTGSGKTLAYSIPIIESLHRRVVPRVRAIILVPTKPLINQVKSTLLQLSSGTNLQIVALKNDISINDEKDLLTRSVPDIIVSTPGRLVEHLLSDSISLSSLQYLIIDEADRLLNQSFQNWSNVLLDKIDTKINIAEVWKLSVQKLVFSATLTTDAGKLSSLKFYNPRLVIVNDSKQLVNEIFTVPMTLSEFKIHLGVAKNSLKPLILTKFLISTNKLSNVLIFTKSNESSIRLTELLTSLFQKLSVNLNVAFINSTNNRTSIRSKILKKFSNQEVNILVTTDLIARGIDVASITDVINYDLPNSSREYVHRVGRTARANQVGYAYSFCFGKGENSWFNKLAHEVSRSKEVENVDLNVKELISDRDEEIYQRALHELQQQAKK